MTRIRIPARRPEDWRALLADPVTQWRVGYSAYELACAWQAADDFPPRVAKALATGTFAPVEMLFGFPEHKVKIEGRGAGSASDLLVIARRVRDGGLVTIAVEGKVGESFDLPVSEWLANAKDENRRKRLDWLAGLLGLVFEERRSDWRVYENHRVPGKQLDLAVVNRRRPGVVALGVEPKYEPDHSRAGGDMRGDTAKFPVCLAEEIARDVESIRRCAAEGLIDVGYASCSTRAGTGVRAKRRRKAIASSGAPTLRNGRHRRCSSRVSRNGHKVVRR